MRPFTLSPGKCMVWYNAVLDAYVSLARVVCIIYVAYIIKASICFISCICRPCWAIQNVVQHGEDYVIYFVAKQTVTFTNLVESRYKNGLHLGLTADAEQELHLNLFNGHALQKLIISVGMLVIPILQRAIIPIGAVVITADVAKSNYSSWGRGHSCWYRKEQLFLLGSWS